MDIWPALALVTGSQLRMVQLVQTKKEFVEKNIATIAWIETMESVASEMLATTMQT